MTAAVAALGWFDYILLVQISLTAKQAVLSSHDALIAADPGYTRLQFAGRTAITVGITLGLLIGLARLLGQSFFSFLIGVVVSMISSVAVNDPEPDRKRITALLIPVPSAALITLGSLLSFSRYAAEAVFVLVMFAAVYVRRFGPRWFAFGMVSFISYFFAMFLHAKPAQLPWMYLAVLIGAGTSFVMREWIMPAPPQPALRHLLPALRARARMIVRAVRAAITGPGRRPRHYRAARRELVRLNELALIFSSHPEQAGWDDAIFDAELTAHHLVELAHRRPPESGRAGVVKDLYTLERSFRRRELVPAGSIAWQTDPEDFYGRLLRGLADSLARCFVGCVDPDESEEPEKNGPPDEEAEAPAAPGGLLPTTRQAIQVAVASLISISGGQLLSSKRWYWAAITAFVVFAGTNSRGDVFIKGWQRVAGTLIGVFVGVLLATVVDGNQPVSLLLIFLSIFLAFYFVQVSYAVMIFWITIMLAFLYGLLGLFSVELLALRLEETVIGAAAGIVVAVLLLPTRTRTIMLENSRAFLQSFRELLEAFRSRLTSARQPGGENVLAAVRDLDRSFQTLQRSAGPLILRVPGLSEPRTSQHWLRVVLRLRYEAHLLARLSRSPEADAAYDGGANVLVAHLEARIGDLADAIGEREPSRRTVQDAQKGDHGFTDGPAENAVTALERCLKRIDWIVTMLSVDLGIAERPIVPRNELSIGIPE